MGVHRRRSWHVTTFPVLVAGFGVIALAVGLMFGGLRSGDAKPADAQVGQPASASGTPGAAVAPTIADSLTDVDLPSSADDASSGTATTTRAPSARYAPHPTAGTTPKHSPTPTPSGGSTGGGSGDGGIQLPKVNLPTFG